MKQTDIESIIQRYTDAEIAVLDGKSITFNGQQMTLENLSEIRKGRQEWEHRPDAAYPGLPAGTENRH